ncbi:MAG: peptidylprolyl isomerase [Candidatus Omnitrophica bacterium]|nr:peptidylprolyl isomerase [Candidatus Omnitrophota bacterium]
MAEVVDRIVAVVNEDIVTQSELMERLNPIVAQYQTVYQGEGLVRKISEARRDILGQIIEDHLILQRAREKGLEASAEQVEERVREVIGKFESEEAFHQAVSEQGLSLEELRQKYRDQHLIQQLIGMEVRSRIIVSPKEIQDYYSAHADDFKTPEKVRARMILIRKARPEDEAPAGDGLGEAEDEATVEGQDLVLEKLERVRALLEQGTPFEEVCKQYSEGPNRDEGGDLGFVSRGEMVEEIDKTLFSLKVSEISGPVESRVGYHFFRVDVRQEASLPAFQEVNDEIENALYQEKFSAAFRTWVNELKEEAFISIK